MGACRVRRFSVAIISERGTVISEFMPIGCDMGYGELRTRDAFLSRRCGHIHGRERSSQRAVRFLSAVGAVVYAMEPMRCAKRSGSIDHTVPSAQRTVRSSRTVGTVTSSVLHARLNRRSTHLITRAKSARQPVRSSIHACKSPHSLVSLTAARGTLTLARGSLSSASGTVALAYAHDRLCRSSACLGEATAQLKNVERCVMHLGTLVSAAGMLECALHTVLRIPAER
jgi:hypothetical protein